MTKRIAALAFAAASLWPSYHAREIPRHAVEHETAMVSAELLLAIAYHESRFDSTAVSRVKRKNGSTALFCGITQATARDEADCVALRDDATAIARTIDELQKWEAMCVRLHAGNPGKPVRFDECALAGYAEGMAGARRGTNRNARMKLATRRKLEGAAKKCRQIAELCT